MDQSIQRLPTAGETVELKYLISSPHLNGKRGKITTYVSDPDRYRYRVNIILDDGSRRVIAVDPQSISLLRNSHTNNNSNSSSVVGSSIRGDDSFYYCPDWDLAHLLLPCHVDSERRCAQFRQCVRSLSNQVGRCRIFVHVSGPPQFRDNALDTLRMAAVCVGGKGGRHHQWIVSEDETGGFDNNNSMNEAQQYQRWESLLSASMDIQPNAWLMFLENCDMYHPLRVQFFHENIKNMREHFRDEKVFSTGGKILVRKLGTEDALPVELFLNGDDSLRDVAEIASTPEGGRGDTLEYFDYCVQSYFFREFLESKKNVPWSHQPTCNRRFLDALTKVAPTPPHLRHTHQNWLYVHYCSR